MLHSPVAITNAKPNEVKHALHNNVFHPNGERLVSFMKVCKTEPSSLPFHKHENVHYLCCSVTVKKPTTAFISRYRLSDKGDMYEQRRKWPLDQLQKVDGHGLSNNDLQLDLYFDRAFKFEAPTYKEREGFLQNVATVCSKHLSSTPVFVNVPYKISKSLGEQSANKDAASTASLMKRNKLAVAERGKKLSDVEQKTAEMANSAKNFQQSAHQLAEHYKN